jgi:hypothetical protein
LGEVGDQEAVFLDPATQLQHHRPGARDGRSTPRSPAAVVSRLRPAPTADPATDAPAPVVAAVVPSTRSSICPCCPSPPASGSTCVRCRWPIHLRASGAPLRPRTSFATCRVGSGHQPRCLGCASKNWFNWAWPAACRGSGVHSSVWASAV